MVSTRGAKRKDDRAEKTEVLSPAQALEKEVVQGFAALKKGGEIVRLGGDQADAWHRSLGGESIRLVWTATRGFGWQLPPARTRSLTQADDLVFSMVSSLHPKADVLKFVDSWNSNASNEGTPPYTSDLHSLSPGCC